MVVLRLPLLRAIGRIFSLTVLVPILSGTLRNDLHNMFVKAVAPYSDKGSDGEGSPMVCKWEFSGHIILKCHDPKGRVGRAPKLKDLLEEWNSTCARFSKDKKDPIAVAIQSIKKNNFKYLACSGSAAEAQPGAIETLTHQLLSGLYEVSIIQQSN
ncbi:hypothetical protein EDB84DRAFT_1443612 [Lactarius hengduanensis]|nr:hypothetical protein EDB84DRAFT_1443612 [Lactarius hengduanensis]